MHLSGTCTLKTDVFKSVFVFVDDVIGLTTEKVKLLNLWNERSFLQRDLWPGADEKQGKASLWTATSVLSMSEVDKQVIEVSVMEEQKVRLVQDVNENRIRNDNVFLQNKKDKGLVLYPELQVIRKGRDDQSDFWGEEAMQWILTQVCSNDVRFA